ncbi:MAG: DNA polymerase III subunit delta' [Gemmatimonadota bacterium]
MIQLHPVVGHEDVRRALAHAHAAGGLPASLLLHGLRGVGKQRLAMWLAQLQLCEDPGLEGPCGACRPCRMALSLEHPDLHWYFPLARPKGVSGDRLADALDAARIEAVNEFRERPVRPSQGDELRGLYLGLIQGLRRKAMVTPTMAAVQIFIIADAEYLVPQEASPEAANALLKLLEEPPQGTRFILTSGEPGRLLPTIRSRSVPLHLSPLPRETVAAFLEEHGGVDAKTAGWAAGLGQGSIGRALGFLPDGEERGTLEAHRQGALRLVEAALADDRAEGFALALDQSPAGARTLVELFAFVEEWLRDLAAVAAGAEDRVLSQDVLPHLRKLAEGKAVDPSAAALALPALEEARELARGNVNPQLIVSGLLRRLRRSLKPSPAATGGV